MIAADTNLWIAWLACGTGKDVEKLAAAMKHRSVLMPPVVLTELLSYPGLPADDQLDLLGIPRVELKPGFWERSGWLRARLIGLGHRPKLADTLIAQACIDHDLPLLTRDAGFKPFAKHGGLRLA